MSKKQLGLWIVTVDFACLTLYAIFSEGLTAFFYPFAFDLATSSVWGVQLIVDFVVALTVAVGWMSVDARERGLPYLPYLVLTLALGSLGPLAYLIHRERAARSAPGAATAAAQAA